MHDRGKSKATVCAALEARGAFQVVRVHTGQSAVKTQDQGDMGPGRLEKEEKKACSSRSSAKRKSGVPLLALALTLVTFATRLAESGGCGPAVCVGWYLSCWSA